MAWHKVAVVDMGGSCTGKLTRKIREKKVYSEVVPVGISREELKKREAQALIICGGPEQVSEDVLSLPGESVFEPDMPVMVLGQAALAWSRCAGNPGVLTHGQQDDYVPESAEYSVDVDLNKLYAGKNPDKVNRAPFMVRLAVEGGFCFAGNITAEEGVGYEVLAADTEGNPLIIYSPERRMIVSTAYPAGGDGGQLLDFFLFTVAGLAASWTPAVFIDYTVEQIKKETTTGTKAVCGLSGGVDSAVAALLVSRALGNRLTCIFVDHGLLREGEVQQVLETFSEKYHLNLIFVDAGSEFLAKLQGVTDPEEKRIIIGEHFIRVFEREAGKLGGDVEYLVQGTIYPDIIESMSPSGEVIKTHHNVGGLPARFNLILLEPLKELYKDEVRQVGLVLGLPHDIVWRQPFPGPGLAVRILGEVTPEKLKIVRQANYILEEEVAKAGLNSEIWQYFAVLPDVRSVGVSGDRRTYAYPVVIRAVTSTDAMTASWYPFPHDVMDRLARRMVEEVEGINRVVYDITSKPPATIEWE